MRTACSTARIRPSSSFIRSRGTLPAASQRSARSRSDFLAASRSVTGSSASASTRICSLTSALAANSASRAALAASRAPKKVSWAARNRFQSSSSTSLGAAPAAFHWRIRSRYRPAVGPQSVESAIASASLTSRSLTHAGALALLVLLREVRLAAAGVRRPRGREPLPQLVVGGAVDARERLPLVEETAQPVGAGPPVAAGGERLGLGDDLLLGGLGLDGALRLLGLAGLALQGDHRAERVEAPDERAEVADGVGLGDLGGDGLDRLGGLLGRHHARPDPLLEQLDLEGQRLEALGEEGHGLFGRARGVLAHRAFAVGRPDVDGAVVVDPSPLVARLWRAHTPSSLRHRFLEGITLEGVPANARPDAIPMRLRDLPMDSLSQVLIAGFPAGPWGTNCYVVATAPGTECVSSTPAWRRPRASPRWSAQHRLKPVSVLVTHGHVDHMWCVAPVAGAYDATAWIHPSDRHLLADPMAGMSRETAQMLLGGDYSWAEPDDVQELGDLQELELAGLRFVVDHTPGHTEGSVTFRSPYDQAGRLRGHVLRRPAVRRLDRPHRPARRRPRRRCCAAWRPRCCPWPTTWSSCPATASRPRSARSARPTRSSRTSLSR